MQKLSQPALSFEEFTLNVSRACLLRRGEEVRLRPKSFEVLRCLVENSGRLVTKDELLSEVWLGTAVTDDSLVQCLVEIRKALSDNEQRLVKTVPRRGYIFQAEVTEVTEIPVLAAVEPVSSLIETTVSESSIVRSTPEETSSRKIPGASKQLIAAAIAICVVVLGVAFASYKFFRDNKELSELHPPRLTRLTSHGKAPNSAISPDGRYVAFVFDDAGKQSIMLRQVATSLSREMVAPFDGYFLGLTFTPDGNSLYYVKGGRGSGHRSLFQVGLLGGEPRLLLDDIDSAVTFSPDGKQFAFLRSYVDTPEEVLLIANADGTHERRVIARSRPQFYDLEDPAWSPDGKRIAFIAWTNDELGCFAQIEEVTLADKAEHKLSTDRWLAINSLAWRSDGKSLVITAKDSMSTPVSPLQLWSVSYEDGQARRVTTDVNNYVNVRPAVNSRTNIAVLQSTRANVWTTPVSDFSQLKQVTSTNQSGQQLSWTPENRIVFTSVDSENRDLWMMQSDGNELRQLTFSTSSETRPVVTADNRYAVYISNATGGWEVWRMDLNGKNAVELSKGQGLDEKSTLTVTTDGKWVLYTTNLPRGRRLVKTSIDGSQNLTIAEKVGLASPTVSRDGKLLAYLYREPAENGAPYLDVVSLESGNTVKTVKLPLGASLLRWTTNSNLLSYVDTLKGVSNIWSLGLNGGAPRQLTTWNSDQILDYQWSNDGKQLAVTRGGAQSDLVLIEEGE